MLGLNTGTSFVLLAILIKDGELKMMKKLAIILLGASMLLAGCAEAPATTPQLTTVEHQTYLVSGRYYTAGELYTEDGNVWEYSQDIISDQPSYDNQPVFALIDDMGTSNQHDDEIVGIMFDVETAIYDELEIRLAEEFSVSREGNNLHLDPK